MLQKSTYMEWLLAGKEGIKLWNSLLLVVCKFCGGAAVEAGLDRSPPCFESKRKVILCAHILVHTEKVEVWATMSNVYNKYDQKVYHASKVVCIGYMAVGSRNCCKALPKQVQS